MLQRARGLRGFVLDAVDGRIGRCRGFVFGDRPWSVRFVVADTGRWLPGRKVLVPAGWLGRPRPWDDRFPVGATKERFRSCPPYKPFMHGFEGRELGSTVDVTGCRLAGSGNELGPVADLILDDDDWSIRYIVVDTGPWLPGRKRLIPSGWLKGLRKGGQKVWVETTLESLERSPRYEAGRLDRQYEILLHRHFGFPPYWKERTEPVRSRARPARTVLRLVRSERRGQDP